jgi:hypothetical protein
MIAVLPATIPLGTESVRLEGIQSLTVANVESLAFNTTQLTIEFCHSFNWKQIGEAISRLPCLKSLALIDCNSGEAVILPLQ